MPAAMSNIIFHTAKVNSKKSTVRQQFQTGPGADPGRKLCGICGNE